MIAAGYSGATGFRSVLILTPLADGDSSEKSDELLDAKSRLAKDRAERSAIELAMIGYDELRERLVTAQNHVARLLAANQEPGARERVNALTARYPWQFRQTATTIVSNRSRGTGR